MGKVYEASTLLAYAKDRVQAYKAFDEQLDALKKALHAVATLDHEFQGKGADSIKGFYTSQVDMVTHWKSLVSSHQSYFNSIADYAEQAKLKGDTVVDVSFLEQELAVANDRSKQMVEQQHTELEAILSNIEDIIHITPFSTEAFEDELSAAEKKRTETITAVEELDNQLSSEYEMLNSFYESVQFSVNGLEQLTSQGGSAYQLTFDAKAYKNSEAYKTQQQIDKVATGYVEGKAEQKQEIKERKAAIEAERQRQIQANKPWYEKGLDIAGELTGYYDFKRAADGVDPVTHKKLSATQRVTAGAMAAAGFIPFVGWAGRAVKGGSVVYKTAKGMSAAHHAMALYQTPKAFKALEQTEKGLYGLVLTNGMYEYTTGKDLLGNKLTKEEQQASLFQSFGIAAGGVLASKMSTQAMTTGAQAVTQKLTNMRNVVRTSKVTQFAKDVQQSMRTMPLPGIDKAKKMYDAVLNTKLPNLGLQELPVGVSPSFAQQTVRDVLKNTAKNTLQFTRDPNSVSRVEQKPVESIKAREEGLGVEETKGQLTEGTGKGNIVNEVKEIDFGKHIIKGKNGKKQLLPNTKYVTNDDYKYTTDELGRIVNVDAPELVLKKADRNKYAQANVGGKDRLPDDDGGHLIGAQFNGPPDIDNLVPQNSQINRRGGVWYEMETEWANALKEIPPKKVAVSIEPIYSKNSMRPDSFMVEYEIEGQFPVIREIANKSGG
ncbi:DNA/RNA non-specific endonuclease [Priestia megaterium]|jgi:predicted ribonuclease toxin of YeeF-YezG toxin-antitoxin module|uniref:DNA/RNA non-specific endonuclease n=2 Tax=Priestia megaterium TaxID=1404 RepID=UPI00227DDE04|nr:DNA/RNA non-specific endonuclease [Priestia megaterium]MCY9024004.1 DNA/RNA non-specific endonuclease [Priestia megaterium]